MFTWGELQGATLYYLLEVTLRGKTYRLSTEPVDVPNANDPLLPDVLHFLAGLEPLEYLVDGAPFESGSLETSVGVSIRFIGTDGWASIAGADQDLGDATAELSLYREGDDYGDRVVLIRGAVDAPAYGRAAENVDFDILSAVPNEALTYPQPGREITEDTWPITAGTAADDGVYQEVYPVVIGEPGYLAANEKHLSQPAGSLNKAPLAGSPALLVEIDSGTRNNYTGTVLTAKLLLATHDCYSNISGANVQIVNTTLGSASAPLATARENDGDGREVTVCSVANTDMQITEGDELWCRWLYRGIGGLPNEDRTSTRRGAGEVIDWLMSLTDIPYDGIGSTQALELADYYRLDFTWNEHMQPWDMVEQILDIVPLGYYQAEFGLRFVFWNARATKSDAIAEINPETMGGERIEPVMRSSVTEVVNQVMLRYWFNPVGGKLMKTLTMGPELDGGDPPYYEVDPYAEASASRYGLRRGPILSTDLVQDTVTARTIVTDHLYRYGFTTERTAYLLPQQYQSIKPGDVVLVTDSEIGWTEKVCLAYEPIRGPGAASLRVHALTDFIRTSTE